MRKYGCQLVYTSDNSGRMGRPANVSLSVSFPPGSFSVVADDPDAETSHRLANRRFNSQSRDSPVDLLARAKWRSDWYDRFDGNVYLRCPRITGISHELRIALICSWDPAFDVVEFRLGDTYYQLSRRPPRGVRLWGRITFPPATHDSPDVASPPVADSAANHEPPSSYEPSRK